MEGFGDASAIYYPHLVYLDLAREMDAERVPRRCVEAPLELGALVGGAELAFAASVAMLGQASVLKEEPEPAHDTEIKEEAEALIHARSSQGSAQKLMHMLAYNQRRFDRAATLDARSARSPSLRGAES